jgi:hypothetical protein
MLGDMATGYIITPHNEHTLARFAKVFPGRINRDDDAPPPLPVGRGPRPPRPPTDAIAKDMPGGDPERVQWSGPVELTASDTSNLSRNMREKPGRPSKVINRWMDSEKFEGWRLVVKFIGQDAEPEIHFVPHSHSKAQKTLMADRKEQPGVWFLMVAGAAKKNPLKFRVKYRYERLSTAVASAGSRQANSASAKDDVPGHFGGTG